MKERRLQHPAQAVRPGRGRRNRTLAGEGRPRAAKRGAKCAPRWGSGLGERQARYESRAAVDEACS